MDAFHRNDFGRAMVVLAETLREQVSDIAVEGYFAALKDLDFGDLIAAADILGRTSKWFPKPAEWREVAKSCAEKRLRAELPAKRDEPWHYECRICEDNGFVCEVCGVVDCIAGTPAHDRRMRRCACVATNRTYQRHNQRHGQAQQPAERNHGGGWSSSREAAAEWSDRREA